MSEDILIFSRRHRLAAVAEEWCVQKGILACPLNIVTALNAMEMLNVERAITEDYYDLGEDDTIAFYKKDGSKA